MKAWTVLKTNRNDPLPGVQQALTTKGGVRWVEAPDDEEATLCTIAAKEQPQIILTCYARVTRKVLEAAVSSLKAVVVFGVGIDGVDCAAARELGIAVCNSPSYGHRTVAEFTVMLLLAAAKRLPLMLEDMRPPTVGAAPRWLWASPKYCGVELQGKNLGFIGYGAIARELSHMLGRGFDMKLSAYDPNVSASAMEHPDGVKKVEELDDMLRTTDVLVVMCTLNDSSRGLLDERRLRLLPKNAILVNTARGAVVDEAAAAALLAEGHLLGAGVDVFSQEPPELGTPPAAMWAAPNALVTPHLAWFTGEADDRLNEHVLDRCLEVLRGQPLTVHSDDPRLTGQPWQCLRRTIFTFFDKGEQALSPFLASCVQSWRVKNPGWRVVVLDLENVYDYCDPGTLPPTFDQIDRASLQADLARLAVLEKYGGLYVDISVACLENGLADRTWDKLTAGASFVGYHNKEYGQEYLCWFMACQSRDPLMSAWRRDLAGLFAERTTDRGVHTEPYFDGVDLSRFRHARGDDSDYLVINCVFNALVTREPELKAHWAKAIVEHGSAWPTGPSAWYSSAFWAPFDKEGVFALEEQPSETEEFYTMVNMRMPKLLVEGAPYAVSIAKRLHAAPCVKFCKAGAHFGALTFNDLRYGSCAISLLMQQALATNQEMLAKDMATTPMPSGAASSA